MNENLLVVEDEPDIRKNLEYNLGREGFKVSAVGSLNDANQKINNNNFELIILDFLYEQEYSSYRRWARHS